MKTTKELLKEEIKLLKAKINTLNQNIKILNAEKDVNLLDMCWFCGKKRDLTKHHLIPLIKAKNNLTIPLCKKHHIDIENFKDAVAIMRKEKRMSLTLFKQIRNSLDSCYL